ncbi:hypothetical protein F0L68_26340 [Solihabitans fulvus]|uniref:Peptidase MA superfamily protein n=1 Tax=Solihabitans fulvus TaxID=1892852 RepID=A0A5B2X089_9PSEU|nr:hypothetical protein F0L68_26340 [Solihabitans fulvus]
MVAAVAVALIVGLALVSQSPARSGMSDGAAAASSNDARQRAVTELLRRRSDAVAHRDRDAFLATVDPQADDAFRAAQAGVFDNLADVPLDSWSYRLDPAGVLDPGSSPTGVRTASELWAPGVELDYALAGVDTAPTTRQMGYLFARRGHDWYLASDTALESHGRRTWRGPWDFGPCQVLRTASGMVISHPGNDAMAHRVAGELDAAVAAVSEVWGGEWSRHLAVLLPTDVAETQALIGSEFAVDGIAGVALSDRVDPATHTAFGQRVVLNPKSTGALSAAALRVVLRHETTHVAARGSTVDGAPMWLLEGFADYVGYRDSGLAVPRAAPDLAAAVRSGVLPTALPGDGDFHSGASKIDLAYEQAWTVNVYLAGRVGEHGLVELYRRLAGLGRAADADVDTVLRESVGTDRAGLLAGWREYLGQTLG